MGVATGLHSAYLGKETEAIPQGIVGKHENEVIHANDQLARLPMEHRALIESFQFTAEIIDEY